MTPAAPHGVTAQAGLGGEERFAFRDQRGVFAFFGILFLAPRIQGWARRNLGILIGETVFVLFESAESGELGLGRTGDGRFRRNVAGRELLGFEPFVEFFGREGDDPETHHGVGITAIFGALAPEIARLVGLHPEVVRTVRDHVDFTGKLGDPE